MRVVAAIPACGLLIGAALGILSADSSIVVSGFSRTFISVVPVAALAVGAVAALWAWRRSWWCVLPAAVAAAFAAGGVLLGVHAERDALRPPLRAAFEELSRAERAGAELQGRALPEDEAVLVTLIGVVRTDSAITPIGASLSLDVDQIWMPCPRETRGGVLLTVIGDLSRRRSAEWRAGRRVRVDALLRRPARYLDPGVPDQERILARRGTTLVGTIKSGALVAVVAKGGLLAETAATVRAAVRRRVNDAVGIRSVRAAAIVNAIVIGDRAGLDDDVERRLQEAGTYHVIAISGGNIAILIGLTLICFRVAGVLGRSAMLVAIAGLLAYAYLVGGGASVDRATLMAVVYLAGRALDLRGPPWNAVALVAGLLVAARPLSLVDPAFLLTFGATVAILGAASFLRRRPVPRPISSIVALFVASLAADAALFPVGAMVFSRVTFAGPIANFAAIPLMAVTQLAGMALVPLSFVAPRLASLAGWVAYVSAEGLVRSADLVRWVPALTWRVAAPHWYVVTGYYLALTAAVLLVNRRRTVRPVAALRAIAATAAALTASWILFEPMKAFTARGDGRLSVTFIDVGQGDAAFVRFPDGSNLLVDSGGSAGASGFDVGDRVVGPVLRDAGVRRLDTLALTHGDADHIGGARSLLAEFRPHDVWEGIPVPPFEPLQRVHDAARAAGSRWINVQAADAITVGDVLIAVRHPSVPDWERQRVRNDDSIVLELRYGNVSVVLTGDIGQDVEGEIAARIPPAPLRIVKVPHHGSVTSSSEAFVRALKPTAAVFSVGRSNSFGHPAPAVIERYRQVGAAIYRTDRDGAVTAVTDGSSVTLSTFTGRRWNGASAVAPYGSR